VRLGAGATACTYLLPPILAQFRERHPGVIYRLREMETERVRNAITAGRLDMGIVTASGLKNTDLNVEPWRTDELILVTGAEVELANPPPFVTFPPGSPSRELLGRHFPEAEVVMELGGIAAIKGNVRAGIGIALVSREAVRRDLSNNHLVEVSDPRTPLMRDLVLIHRGIERLPPAAAAVRELLLASA